MLVLAAVPAMPDGRGSLTLVSLIYLWKRGFARAHRTPLATGLRIQGPGELCSVTPARQYRRKRKGGAKGQEKAGAECGEGNHVHEPPSPHSVSTFFPAFLHHPFNIIRWKARWKVWLARLRSANIFLQGIYNCTIEEEPFSPSKIYCSVIFIHSRVKTVQLFVINNIFQLYCNFILRLYMPQMQQLEYMLRKH